MQQSRTWLTTRFATLLPILLPSLIAGVINISYGIAFAAIIFSGEMAPYLSLGIGIGLFSTVVVVAVTALFSTLPGTISMVQDVPALLISLVVSNLVVELSPADRLPTVLALLATTSLLVGGSAFLLGQFRLGNLIRFIPYPVIGGFLAGTGWFLSLGAVLMLTRLPQISSVGELLNPIMLLRWVPGCAFAVLLLWLQRRYGHPLTLPGLILGSLLLFFLMLGLTQTPLSTVQDLGLLLGPFADGEPWRPLQWQLLTQANWGLIIRQWNQLAVLLAVTLMALLLNITSLEVVVRQDINLNRELRAVGLANLLSGMGGGLIGFHSLGLSALCKTKLEGHSRWVGLIAASLAGLVLVFGTSAVAIAPRFVLGGLVLYLGLDFLLDWIWLSRHNLPTVDYVMVVALLVTMATLGVLPAVGLGILFSIAIFVLNYSRTNVIRHRLSGHTLSSHIYRVAQQQRTLQNMGDQIQILQLQGYLFFGSANQLLQQVKQLFNVHSQARPQFVVLDFSQVTGMDSSAVYSFIRLKQTTPSHVQLILTHLSPANQRLLNRAGCLAGEPDVYHIEPNLEQGLQWCEERLLEAIAWRRERYLPLPMLLETLFADEAHIPAFMTYLEKLELSADTVLFQQGEQADQLYFLESGQISTQVDVAGHARREWIYKPGTTIGATAFYAHQPHSATALVEQPSIVYSLHRSRWQEMKDNHPQAATLFQEVLLAQLAERLQKTSAGMSTLLF